MRLALVARALRIKCLGLLQVADQQPAPGQGQGRPIGGQRLPRGVDGRSGLVDPLGLDQVLDVGQPVVRDPTPQLDGAAEFLAGLVAPPGGRVEAARASR